MKSFDEFWKVYPRRKGANPKGPAEIKFLRWVASGINPEDIIGGARAYAASSPEIIGTCYIAQAITWLNQSRWKDYTPIVAKKLEDYDAIASRHGYVWNGEKYVRKEETHERVG